jgi:polyisoprenyl-phosphate glycosyltransferase
VAFKVIVIIPLFNEEQNIVAISEAIAYAFRFVRNVNYEILFVDDGSTDGTLTKIKQLESEKGNLSYLSFSRNFGKEAALLAGFQHADSDAVITMDGDLQHPPELIPDLLDYWQKGYEIVYTYRQADNKHSPFFSRFFSRLFYFVISKLADVKLENGLSDYKLVDKKVVEVVKEMKEADPFLRGIFKWVGYNQKRIAYTPDARLNGHSKYSKRALLSLAVQSITSFSTKPLSMAIYIGFFISAISVLYLPYVLYSLYNGYAISGWASTIVTISFFGGIQLIILGIIGLYLGKLFMQSKGRPPYLIRESKIKSEKSNRLERHEKHKKVDTFG